MSEFIEFLSPKAQADLDKANASLLQMISNVEVINKTMAGVKTPSGSDGAIKELNAKLLKQEELFAKVQIKLEQYAQAQNRTKISSNQLEKSNISLEQAIERKNKALEREATKLQAAQTLYSKLGQKLALLRAEYSELATKQQLRGRLSDEEAKRLDFLTQKTQKYVLAQDAVNTTMGKYQQRVGAYGGQFNSLGNSINQLTREMPAFTYSVQTGFMALSNNIPIFSDAIGDAIRQNKALQKEGKPTTSVLSQVAGAFLSWQTLMGVGITLLTVYGKEIGDWISSMNKASKAIDVQKESQKSLNEISAAGQKNAVEETLKVRSLLEIAKDTALSYKERMIAVKELQDTYPFYFENLTKEQILAGQTADAENALTEAILSRAKANAAIGKITENQSKIIDFEIERLALRKELKQIEESILVTEKKLQNSDNVSNSQGIALSQMYDKRANVIGRINKLSGEKHSLDVINNTLTDYSIEKQKEAIGLDYKKEKIKKDSNREQLEAIQLLKATSNSLIVSLENEIKFYEELRDKATNTAKEYEDFNKIVKALKSSLDLMKDPSKYLKGETDSLVKQQELLQKHKESWEEIEKAMQSYTDSFVDSFVNNSGFQTTFDILSGKILGFGYDAKVTTIAVMESFQEMYNFISELSTKNYEAEYNNLEKSKNIALAFAGDSESARLEIEKQAEERRREIAKREFNAKKELAKTNIIINTAQAVVAALPNIPLSILIGLLGAVQLAKVNSQKMPEFWQGTDNAPEGLAWTQEKGAEVITDKKGRVKTLGSNKGAVLTKLDAGDKVYTAQKSKQLMFNSDFSEVLFNSSLSNMMQSAGIGMSDNKPQIDIRQDLHQLGREVVSAINNKTEYHQTFDGNGIKNYISNGHTTKEIKNNHVTFKQQSV